MGLGAAPKRDLPYDLSPGLSASERGALTTWTARHPAPGEPRKMTSMKKAERAALGRLLLPLRDAVEAFELQRGTTTRDGERSRSNPGVAWVCAWMGRTGTAFWAWEGEEWARAFDEYVRCRLGPASPCARADHKGAHYLAALRWSLRGELDLERLVPLGNPRGLARALLGEEAVGREVQRVVGALLKLGLPQHRVSLLGVRVSVARVLCYHGRTSLDEITLGDLEACAKTWGESAKCTRAVWSALVSLGVLAPLPYEAAHPYSPRRYEPGGTRWSDTAKRWAETSHRSAKQVREGVLTWGRVEGWLAEHHPEVRGIEDWDRRTAGSFVEFVSRLRRGGMALRGPRRGKEGDGKPVGPGCKQNILSSVATVFSDAIVWGWVEPRFDPRSAFRLPIRRRGGKRSRPRPIDDHVWDALVLAARNLRREDVSRYCLQHYSFPVVKAFAVVLTHSGIRLTEMSRLEHGCLIDGAGPQRSSAEGDPLRPSHERGSTAVTRRSSGGAAAGVPEPCRLLVPAGKSTREQVKHVSGYVREAIVALQAVREPGPPAVCPLTGARKDFLFQHKGRLISRAFSQRSALGMLIRASGVGNYDSRGKITPGRARATAATRMYHRLRSMEGDSAEDPMLTVSAWMGHTSTRVTEHYVLRGPDEKLLQALREADRVAFDGTGFDLSDPGSGGSTTGTDTAGTTGHTARAFADGTCTNPFGYLCESSCRGCPFDSSDEPGSAN